MKHLVIIFVPTGGAISNQRSNEVQKHLNLRWLTDLSPNLQYCLHNLHCHGLHDIGDHPIRDIPNNSVGHIE